MIVGTLLQEFQRRISADSPNGALESRQNVVAAQARLGEMYLNGDQVPPHFAQAKLFLERAALMQIPGRRCYSAKCTRVGLGTPVDQKHAYAWSEVASLEGSEFAKRERDASLRDLSVGDQQAAVAQAKDILKEIKQQTIVPTTSDTQ
jgi:TPR repeat protein